MARNPLTRKNVRLTKELLEDYLGLGRYRRFESIYDELVENRKMTGKTHWSDQDSSWFYGFYASGKPIFSIKWGHDYYFASVLLKDFEYLNIVRNNDITPEALELMHKHKINQMKGTALIEVNLEIMSEQHAFFDLLNILIVEMHKAHQEESGGGEQIGAARLWRRRLVRKMASSKACH